MAKTKTKKIKLYTAQLTNSGRLEGGGTEHVVNAKFADQLINAGAAKEVRETASPTKAGSKKAGGKK